MKYFGLLILTILLWPTALLAADDTCVCYNDDNGCVLLSIFDEIDCQDTCLADYTNGNGSVVEASDPNYTNTVNECLNLAAGAAGGSCFCYEGEDCTVLAIFDMGECEIECDGTVDFQEPTSADYTTSLSDCDDAHAAAIAEEPSEPIIPNLSVNIPGLSFSPIVERAGFLEINFIAEYVVALYKWLLGTSIIVATVMIMVGGVQYMTGSPDKGMKRIRGAVTGAILLFGSYVILFTVNPQLTLFQPVFLETVEQMLLNLDTGGDEGLVPGAAAGGGSGPTAYDDSVCRPIIDAAQANGTCPLSEPMQSPTGRGPGCGYHFGPKGASKSNYYDPADFAQIRNLDYGASWDSEIRAPFDGQVTYTERSSSSSENCGNTIKLKPDGISGHISLCHIKDFTDEKGAYKGNRQVVKGEVLGHLGGICCYEDGTTVPTDWSMRSRCTKVDSNTTDITLCQNPKSAENCNCQKFYHSGNTSGPHVHISWRMTGNILACLDVPQ